ncbi:receptor-type adenylate cyclase GRESAG 4, putative [Trypanosoma brucei brucei TREU927]|uniref:adenylate cyclase n=1 Tax=Trypanosoma brucei brucei (strain 927/4 GUTat10.1) TaxID=185431 RepID=Q583D1_TRYB2|nr:receptor-type adenylate cyclase GRESAG 4, putative [Trypanosoma brucei brucei TREU927]AAX80524.1 receptor-type adenylate cyclase GRESAG 4, putative [Trypanosoma brucei]AAZ11036.1 receptor-type adenylate cyclase GRESAG 4, putative [Trypanosoma brucei brucei TREU927]
MVTFMRELYVRDGAVTYVVFSLLLQVLTASSLANDKIQVKVYNMLYSNKISAKIYDPIIAGFNASITNGNPPSGANVEVVYVPPMDDSKYADFLNNETSFGENNKISIILGPVGDQNTLGLLKYFKEKNVTSFSPFTGSSKVRSWNPNLYFLTASPAAEMLALLRYAITQLRLHRLGFMYLKDVSYGDDEYKLAVELTTRMDRKLCGVFALKSQIEKESDDSSFSAEWNKFANTRPQGVIVFGSPIPDTKKFLIKSLEDERTKGGYLLIPSTLQYVIKNKWSEELGRDRFVPGKIIITGTNPLAKDDGYDAIKRFRGELANFLKVNGNNFSKDNWNVTLNANENNFTEQDTEGELMVSGWIAGEVLKQALSCREWLTSRDAFITSLYNQRRYVIDDIVVGDFGGECRGMAGERGASCLCNQGGNVVYMKKMEEDHRLYPMKEGVLALTSSRCYRDLSQLYAPLSGIMFKLTDDPKALRTAEAIYDGAFYVVGKGQLGHSDRFFLHWLSSKSHDTSTALYDEVEKRVVTAVFGVVDDSLLSTKGMAFIDPITLTPQLSNPRRNVIHLSPTLEQQLFVIVEHIIQNGAGKMHAIVRSGDTKDIGEMLNKTLDFFESSLSSFVASGEGSTLRDKLPTAGEVLVAGLISDDIPIILSHLGKHHNVRIFVPFFDVALLYDELVSAFRDKPFADRLLFATNLPHWGDKNTESDLVREFHRVVQNESKWKPLSLLGYVTARAMINVLQRMGHVTPEDLVDAIFSQSVITVDDMRYGPFDDKCTNGASFEEKHCAVNYGATHISVWSMSRVLNPSVSPVVTHVTPLMMDGYAKWFRLKRGHIAAIAVSCVVVLALFVTVLLLVIRSSRRNARDNNNAPKEPTDPVTLIFTDIESSTAQWAAHPEQMPDLVATHHRLIRSLITRYECYEVKTVGDSFMIACKSPFAAAQLACDLQRDFLNHDWKTTELDESYREFERKRAEDDSDYTPPTASLDPEVYRQLWNGLRVRVGIHTGLCDIRHDEVTKGYDYYGRTSNMAARTESVGNGGQVLMTRSTYLSLSGKEREQINVTPLGDVPLRGVPKPVEMYQLNAVPGRTFAALRLDRDVEDEENEESEGIFTDVSDICSSTHELCGSSLHVAQSLETVLGTLPATQRQRMLTSICERWRVPPPKSVKNRWDKATFRLAVHHIAVRAGPIMNVVIRNSTGTALSTERSSFALSHSICDVSQLGRQHPLPSVRFHTPMEVKEYLCMSPTDKFDFSIYSCSTIDINMFNGTLEKFDSREPLFGTSLGDNGKNS